MTAEMLLQEISDYCRRVGMAESTFGRRAVNDGKFAGRLRFGGRVTLDTVERVQTFIKTNPPREAVAAMANDEIASSTLGDPVPGETARANGHTSAAVKQQHPATPESDPEQTFRFYDNRQKYLMFVNTCSEKWVVAGRIGLEIGNIHPHPPAIRIFDAGVGDGTVLTRTMRTMHHRFPMVPFYLVGKEISLEDVRLALEKMPDRFTEHPPTVLVMTNLNYAEASHLTPNSIAGGTSMVWHEVALQGDSAAEFDQQIAELQPFLAENWRATVSKKSGNPTYEKPVVLVIYRQDCKFILDQIIPRRGAGQADYDLIIASQPYRARASVAFKAKRVIAPLALSLAPGGRLIGIHSNGGDPGLEIIQAVWPGEDPFQTNRHDLLKATKAELGSRGRDLNFNTYADSRSLFRYDMHTLPTEIGSTAATIGTSTLFAAWNAATYVAQIEDQRLAAAMSDDKYLRATTEVLKKNGSLWFWDESYVISRKRDSL